MREIKFRGKRLDNGEWAYGYLWIIPGVNLHYILTGKINVRDCSIEKYEVDPETVGQYTGLKDRNGKEIFEGDILEGENGKRYLIKWGINSNGFIAKANEPNGNIYSSYHLAPKTKIIGNIYSKPDLLAVIEG